MNIRADGRPFKMKWHEIHQSPAIKQALATRTVQCSTDTCWFVICYSVNWMFIVNTRLVKIEFWETRRGSLLTVANALFHIFRSYFTHKCCFFNLYFMVTLIRVRPLRFCAHSLVTGLSQGYTTLLPILNIFATHQIEKMCLDCEGTAQMVWKSCIM